MHQLMTIQDFSMKTGIPKSTLRFYESKQLLVPIRHEKSNYRMYTEEQIPRAKLISSLRIASIPIRDIQLYVQTDRETQTTMKRAWIEQLKKQQSQLEMGIRYLESDQQSNDIYLFKKSAETVIWFQAEAPPGQFSQALVARREQIRRHAISVNNTYIKYQSGTRKIIQVAIGFGVSSEMTIPFISGASVEELNESLCIGLAFHGNFSHIETGYRKLFRYCAENDWSPSGSVFEWYRGDQIDETDIIIPVTEQGGER